MKNDISRPDPVFACGSHKNLVPEKRSQSISLAQSTTCMSIKPKEAHNPALHRIAYAPGELRDMMSNSKKCLYCNATDVSFSTGRGE